MAAGVTVVGRWGRLKQLGAVVVAEVRAGVAGHDGWLLTAGVAFYALLAAVPSLVVAVRVTAAITGPARVDALAAAVGQALPAAQHPAPLIEAFITHAAGLRWRAAAVAVIPATVWGEGLRRGFGRLTPPRAGWSATTPPGRWEGWRARAAVIPVLLLSPLGLLGVLGVAPELTRLIGHGGIGAGRRGVGGTAAAFYLALNVDWIVVSAVLMYVYRWLGPVHPGWRPLLAGSFFTGAFISGFLQGFVVFLAIPVHLGSPFGGLTGVGATIAVALWVWLFTAVSLLGYLITTTLDHHWRTNVPTRLTPASTVT